MRTQLLERYVLKHEKFIINAGGCNSLWNKPRLLRDEGEHKNIVLERYFYDLYNMFLKRITNLAAGDESSEYEHRRIKMLLDELLKVKGLLEREDK